MSRPLHRPTVLAAAMVAYLAAKLVHEGLGHGGACLAFGGGLEAVSTSWCDCDKAGLTAWAVRAGKAAGTLANLGLGALALGLLRARRWRGATPYGLWILAAVNLFMGAGYLLTDPIFGFGDWTAFLEGIEPALPWRVGLVGAGAAVAWGSIRALVPHLGAAPARKAAGRQLALLPWAVVGGLVMTGVAATNIYGLQFAFTSALATVGGTSFLAWCHTLDRLPGRAEALAVPRDGRWLGAGAVALVLAVVVGHGVVLGW